MEQVGLYMEDLLEILRKEGWMVAVHNDYTLSSEFHTFWLFTHARSGRFVKGEGKSNHEALTKIVAETAKLRENGWV